MSDSPLKAIRELTKAWIRKDTRGMSSRLAEDIIEIGPAFPEALAGKRRFFRKYRDYLSGPLQILSYTLHRPRTVMLSAREALVFFNYRMRTSLNGKTEDSIGKESMLVRCNRGVWRIRFIHWHRDP